MDGLASEEGREMSGYINLNSPVCRTPEGEQIVIDMFSKRINFKQARELLMDEAKRAKYFLFKQLEGR